MGTLAPKILNKFMVFYGKKIHFCKLIFGANVRFLTSTHGFPLKFCRKRKLVILFQDNSNILKGMSMGL